jgi:cbb3-type cytochrome oxidase subunit 1
MTSKLRPYDEPPRPRQTLIPSAPDSAATAFLVVSALWFAAAAGIGALAAGQALLPDVLKASFSVAIGSGITIDVTRATVQPAFLDALVYGWISNAAFAAIFFATPRLTGRRLMSEPLAMLGAGAWNVAVAAGVALLYVKGASGTASLSEFPLPVQALALLGLLAINGAFWGTVAAARSIAYVGLAYFGIGLLALLGCMTLAAVPSVVSLGDTNNLLLWAFTARGIVTLWVLGAALGTLYYVIPRATRNPLYSNGLAYLALAGWVAFGGLSAVGALVDPSVPYVITSLGQAGTLLLIAPVFLAVANMLGTMSGRWTLLFSAGSIPLAVSALVFLTGASLLESVGALRSVRTLTAGTDWGLGVTVIAVLGGGTLAFAAFIEHAAPRLLRRGWSGGFLTDAELWAIFAGSAIGGLSMIGGGIIEGSLMAQAVSADTIDSTVLLFRLAAAGGLGLAALGSLAMLANLFLLYTSGHPADYGVPTPDVSTAAAGH